MIFTCGCTRIGKRPCDIPDTTWQTKDGKLTIYGRDGTKDGYTMGKAVIDGEEVDVILFYNVMGWAEVYKYEEGQTSRDYYFDIETMEMWIAETVLKNRIVYRRDKKITNSFFDELFDGGDKLVVHLQK